MLPYEAAGNTSFQVRSIGEKTVDVLSECFNIGVFL